MARLTRFTFVCTPRERSAIAELASHLQRSQSDAVRVVVAEAARRLTQADYLASTQAVQDRGGCEESENGFPR